MKKFRSSLGWCDRSGNLGGLAYAPFPLLASGTLAMLIDNIGVGTIARVGRGANLAGQAFWASSLYLDTCVYT